MVKKIMALLMAGMVVLGASACGNTNSTSEENKIASQEKMNTSTEQEQNKSEMEDTSAEADGKMKKALVVYFSAMGNTKAVAETLSEIQGADLYEIVPEEPYSDEDLDYSDRSHRAIAEQAAEADFPEHRM